MTKEPRWITTATLLAIHSQQVERFGGAHGIHDQRVVRSALAGPPQRWRSDSAADAADFAAAYLVGFARSRAFNDGNRRTGLACALVFLARNGKGLQVSVAELHAVSMAAASQKTSEADVAAYLRARTQ